MIRIYRICCPDMTSSRLPSICCSKGNENSGHHGKGNDNLILWNVEGIVNDRQNETSRIWKFGEKSAQLFWFSGAEFLSSQQDSQVEGVGISSWPCICPPFFPQLEVERQQDPHRWVSKNEDATDDLDDRENCKSRLPC